jgi:SNF2 family DNA or RNA helicase
MFASLKTSARKIAPKHELWIPHVYQDRSVDFLLDRNAAALFLDPGMGKTSIVLEAFMVLQREGIAKKMLVIAPKRVCELVWRQESRKWTQFRDLRFVFLHGPKKKQLLKKDADVYLINPEGVAWLTKQFADEGLPYDTITIDELTKFKNGQAVRFKALRPPKKQKVMPLAKVKRIWGLTGTPIPNGYLDLFGQMKMLDGGAALGQYYTHFRNKYFEKGYTGFDYTIRRGASRQIEALIEPYVLRMSADDYLELPPLVPVPHYVDLPDAARKTYAQMKKDMIALLPEGKVEAGNAAAVYSKLKQMGNGAVYAGDGVFEPRRTIQIHDAKIDALEELVEELQGQPLMVAYEFNHDLARLRERFGKKTPYIGSGVSSAQVMKIEKDWNAGKIPVLFVHPQSAGHGLNFQLGNACHVAWFSITWDYELYDQLIKRIFRQGNKALRVFNHLFIVRNTIDEKSLDAISEKGFTQHSFFDALNAEICHDGKAATSPYEGTNVEDLDMVRKLKRKAQEEVENEEEEGEAEEEVSTKRVSKRGSAGTKRKLKREEPEDEPEGEEEDEEEDEPIAKKAKKKFDKTASKRRARSPEPEPEPEEEEEYEEVEIDYEELAVAVCDEMARRLAG